MEIIAKICILIIFCLIGLLLGGCIKKSKPKPEPEPEFENNFIGVFRLKII